MPASGVIYVLVSAGLPGRVVIGQSTTKSAVERARELSAEASSLPSPLEVHAQAAVSDAVAALERVHGLLERHRVPSGGEGPAWFDVPPAEAAKVMKLVAAMFASGAAGESLEFRTALSAKMRSILASMAGFPVDAILYCDAAIAVMMVEAVTYVDARTGRLLQAADQVAAIAADRGRFVVMTQDGVVRAGERAIFDLGDRTFDAAAIHGPSKRLVISDSSNTLTCLDMNTGKRLWRTSRVLGALSEERGLQTLAFDSAGAFVASLSRDGELVVRDMGGHVVGRHAGIGAFAWHPSSSHIAVCLETDPPTVALFERSLKQSAWAVRVDDALPAIAISPDGRCAGVGVGDHVSLVRFSDGKPLASVALPINAEGIAFGSLDGRLLLAAAGEGTLCQLDVTKAAG